MDHSSLLGLGNLDMEGMRNLCVLKEDDEIPKGVLIDGFGRGCRRIGGGGIGDDVGIVAGNDVGGAINDDCVVVRSDVGGVGPVSSSGTLYCVLPLRGCEKNLEAFVTRYVSW